MDVVSQPPDECVSHAGVVAKEKLATWKPSLTACSVFHFSQDVQDILSQSTSSESKHTDPDWEELLPDEALQPAPKSLSWALLTYLREPQHRTNCLDRQGPHVSFDRCH